MAVRFYWTDETLERSTVVTDETFHSGGPNPSDQTFQSGTFTDETLEGTSEHG